MALDPINTHSNLPLGKLQEEVHEWIANHGVRYFNELTNMAQLTEEQPGCRGRGAESAGGVCVRVCVCR